MRVLAFDPGYERLGVAVLEKQNGKDVLLFSDCIRTGARTNFAQRLNILGEEVEKMIKKWKPDAAALENLYFEKNAKTAMDVSAVRGMLLYVASSNNLCAHEYTPLQVKVAITGYGKSDKRAVAMMVNKLIKISGPSTSFDCAQDKSLRVNGKLDDEIDAIAVGLTHLASARYPQRIKK